MTREEFWKIAVALKPGLTRKQYAEMWERFIAMKERRAALRSSLRVIHGRA